MATGGAWSFGRRSEQTGLGRNKLLSSMAGVVRSIETCLEVDLSLDGKGFRRQWLGFRRQEVAAGDSRLSPAQAAAGRRQAVARVLSPKRVALIPCNLITEKRRKLMY